MGAGKRPTKTGKHIGEDRNHIEQQEHHNDEGNSDNHCWIDQGSLDLGFERRSLFHIGGQTRQNRIEDTTRLTGFNHIDEEVTIDSRMLAEGVCKTVTGFHIRFDLTNNPGKLFVCSLPGQDIQALDERQSGLDHRGKLPGEDHELLLRDLAPESREFQFQPFGFRPDRGHQNLPLSKHSRG